MTDTPQPIKKGEITYLPLPLGTEVPEAVHFSVWWGQKTLPTKIFTALSGEDISQTSGERKTTFAKGGEIVFDNGQIPLERTLAGSIKSSRHDAFIPTAPDGTPTGLEIRDRDYRRIAKGVEAAHCGGLNGGEDFARDYSYYLPKPNPQLIIHLNEPVYIPNAFGKDDHQFLDEPVLRLDLRAGKFFVKGGLNGPEAEHSWTELCSFEDHTLEEVRLLAEGALIQSEKQFVRAHRLEVIRSLPTRWELGRLKSRPESHGPV